MVKDYYKKWIQEGFKFNYIFWYQNSYVVTSHYRDTVYTDYTIAEIATIPIEDYYDIMEVEFNAIYVTANGYKNKVAFKTMADVEKAIEWLNSLLILHMM